MPLQNILKLFLIKADECPGKYIPKWKWYSFVGLILLGALGLRILYPHLYMAGSDLPGHIMASMRLHVSSFLNVQTPETNFFVQLFRFKHGYTTLLFPYIGYEIVFSLLKLPITEAHFVYIHSLFGILSLMSIGYFTKLHFGAKSACLTLILLAIIPLHIGISRAHIGQQIIQLTFFYGSLSFLALYLANNHKKWKLLYYIAVFFYIGADNIFPVGLALHVSYILLPAFADRVSLRARIAILGRLYYSFSAVIAIGVPIVMYIGIAVMDFRQGYPMGEIYLLRAIGRTGATDSSVSNFFNTPFAFLRSLGPVSLPCILGIFGLIPHIRRLKKRFQILFVLVVFLTYLLLLGPKLGYFPGSAHGLYPGVPLIIIAGLFLVKRPILTGAVGITTILYSFFAIYGMNFGTASPMFYGSVDFAKGNDAGVKTLGYLVRTHEFENLVKFKLTKSSMQVLKQNFPEDIVSINRLKPLKFWGFSKEKRFLETVKQHIDAKQFEQWRDLLIRFANYNTHSGQALRTGIFIDYEGASYYFGKAYHNTIEQGALGWYDVVILAYVTAKPQSERNSFIKNIVEEHNLNLIGYVVNSQHILLELYANIVTDTIKHYDVNDYNAKFNQEFGTFDTLLGE